MQDCGGGAGQIFSQKTEDGAVNDSLALATVPKSTTAVVSAAYGKGKLIPRKKVGAGKLAFPPSRQALSEPLSLQDCTLQTLPAP